MCGIVGRFNFREGVPLGRNLIERMVEYLLHRGPDGKGVFQEGPIGLGHRRLNVIDLTPAAQQPMVTEDGNYRITYNGEIYNFKELRSDLERLGYRFRSASDTEVVLKAYQEYGIRSLEYLRGMFALAIWDQRNRSLFLARDRIGKKPLYYWLDKHGIAFASEPKAFLGDPCFRPEPNLNSLHHYLIYHCVPGSLSAFQGVQKLKPGHFLFVKDGRVKEERYWKLSYSNKFKGTFVEAVEEIKSLLDEAVRIRLISDVPLGAFLSGGIDSSAIVGMMANEGVSPLKTFSIGFGDDRYNELHYARLIAKKYETDHQEFIVTPKAKDILEKLVWHYNEPYADSSAIPTFYLARLAKEHITVALNGDGGDESFGGYDRYVASVMAGIYDGIPEKIKHAFGWLRPVLLKIIRSQNLGRFFDALSDQPIRRYVRWVCHFDPFLHEHLLTDEFLKNSIQSDPINYFEQFYKHSDAREFVERIMDIDVNTYLPDDLLVKVDIATMASGLEGRSPFLDHKLMEFCSGLPGHFKVRGLQKKYILKKATQLLLPHEIINRPKMGFGVPIERWFREDLKEMAFDILLSERSLKRGYFQVKTIRRILEEHVSGIRAWHYQIWNLLMLELWYRMFIDGDAGETTKHYKLAFELTADF